jgi:hypothetical protein
LLNNELTDVGNFCGYFVDKNGMVFLDIQFSSNYFCFAKHRKWFCQILKSQYLILQKLKDAYFSIKAGKGFFHATFKGFPVEIPRSKPRPGSEA